MIASLDYMLQVALSSTWVDKIMAMTAETNFDEFKGKDCVFVAEWLKSKGLQALFRV